MTSDEEAQARAREIIQQALADYAAGRIRSYETLRLRQLLDKDVLMFALRGVSTAHDFVDEAFAAFESSSEETGMGSTRQRIITELGGAIDLADLVIQRDNVLWAVEVKAQTNTITGTALPQVLRNLKSKADRYRRSRPARPRQVRAMLGIMRGPSDDRERTYVCQPGEPNTDIDGFTYRYIVGRSFWVWLTGWGSIESLVDRIEEIADSVAAAREEARARLHREMDAWMQTLGLDGSIQSIMAAVDDGKRP